MEIKASFATKDLPTMGSKGLTAPVRKLIFFIFKHEARTYSWEKVKII